MAHGVHIKTVRTSANSKCLGLCDAKCNSNQAKAYYPGVKIYGDGRVCPWKEELNGYEC